MVRLTIFTRGGDIVEFTVAGHSGYQDKGQDIVCAGVSAITQTAAAGLHHHLGGKLLWEQAEGKLRVKLNTPLTGEEAQAAQVIFKTMQLGIEAVRESYPEYVKVEYKEV